MIKRLVLAVAVNVSLMTTPVLAHAPIAPNVAEQGTQLVIPFNPPVGRDILYKVTITKIVDGRETTVMVRQNLRFTRASDGYTLLITMLDITANGRVVDVRSGSVTKLPVPVRLMLIPLNLDVSAKGELVRVRDWPKVRQALALLPDVVDQAQGASSTAARARGREAARRMAASYIALTPEQAPDAIIKGWPTMFGRSGLQLQADAQYRESSEILAALLPVMIPFQSTYSLSKDTDGSLRFRLFSKPDQKTTSEAVAAYLVKMGEGLDATGRSNLQRAAEAMRSMTVQDTVDASYDPVTGLVKRGQSERVMTFQGLGSGGERVLIERSD